MRVIITGGGTGGHLYPVLAIGRAFQERGAEVRYIGSQQGIEKDVVNDEIFVADFLPVEAIRNKNLFTMPKAMWKLAKSYLLAKKIVQGFKPDLIIGTGGYASFPVLKAGAALGVKTLIHEANADLGKANAYLGTFVDCLCLTYKSTAAQVKNCRNIKITGMPVRESVKTADRQQGSAYLAVDEDALVVTITGGSQGSRHINEAMLTYYREFSPERKVLFYHIVGKNNAQDLEALAAFPWVQAKLYEENMDLVLARTDIIISRAGASSLAEIAACGLAAILVPYPFSQGHQEKNALHYHQSNCAVMVLDKDLPRGLITALDELIANQARREALGRNMAKEAKDDALERIVDAGLGLI